MKVNKRQPFYQNYPWLYGWIFTNFLKQCLIKAKKNTCKVVRSMQKYISLCKNVFTKVLSETMSTHRVSLAIQHDNKYPIPVVFTPNGRYIVSGWGGWILGDFSEVHICIHDISTATLIRKLLGHTEAVLTLALTSDGQYLVSASRDKTVVIWEMDSGEQIHNIKHVDDVSAAAFSQDNKLVITCTCGRVFGPNNEVNVWSVNNGSRVYTIEHSCILLCLAVSPMHIVSASYDCFAYVWLLADGTPKCHIKHPGLVRSVDVTRDSQHIVTVCRDGCMRLFRLTTGELIHELRLAEDKLHSFGAVVNNHHIVSYANDKARVCVWNHDFTLAITLNQHAYRAAVHPNGKQIALVSEDRTVRLVAFCRWSDRDHQLFGAEFKSLVFLLMCCKERLDSESQQAILPKLPMAVWLDIFKFLEAVFD